MVEGSVMEQREGESEAREAEEPWPRRQLEVTCPPCSRGQRQLSLKHYLNLHGLGSSPPHPQCCGQPYCWEQTEIMPCGS